MRSLLKRPAYWFYERHLQARLNGMTRPRHIGIVMDGNRRWARQMGLVPSVGHRYGGEHIDNVLAWSAEQGVTHVTIFVASTDNLLKRPTDQISHLLTVVEDVTDRLSRPESTWQVHIAGRLDSLPDTTRHALKLAEERTRARTTGMHVTFAIGYGGREEVVDALRSLLDEEAAAGADLRDVAERITDQRIAAHLYTAGHPDPDLIIRTSGEQRLSGFLLWQSAHSELYFCDTYWPAFRKVDFLRALRAYATRDRRYGR
ncbi:polyprenyl diphosphate synthase [Actinomycetes bacterium KLBMP 9759]